MGLATIRKQYGVPAKRGQRLFFTDTDGVRFLCTIKSARDGHLSVLVDDRVLATEAGCLCALFGMSST